MLAGDDEADDEDFGFEYEHQDLTDNQQISLQDALRLEVATLEDCVGDDDYRVLVESTALPRPLMALRASCEWRDQDVGNTSGRIQACLFRAGGVVADCDLFGVCRADGRPGWSTVQAELGFDDPFILAAQTGDRVVIRYLVGGGGGHKLHVRNFCCELGLATGVQSNHQVATVVRPATTSLLQSSCGVGASADYGEDHYYSQTPRWEQKTLDSLSQAKALTRLAFKSLMDAESMPSSRSSKRSMAVASNANVVAAAVKKKINIAEDLIKALEVRIESVEDTIRQAGECLFQLQRALRSKWAPLNVCERRLQLRDGRPAQELVRDSCQEALEHERQTIINARQGLSEQIDSMKEMLLILDRTKSSLLEDLQSKRHGLRLDRSCLSPKKPVSSRNQDRLVLPKLQDADTSSQLPTPKGDEPGGLAEEDQQADTRTLLSRAVRSEEDAMRLANDSDAVIFHTARECTRATAQVQAELARHVEEVQVLKKQLEAQMQETDETIAQTELSVLRTKKKLEMHDQPLRILNRQLGARGGRTPREGVRDKVQEEMEMHFDNLQQSVKLFTARIQALSSLVEQLKASKAQLQEDYRSKQLVQKIDDACMRVTPRKAIELDRTDPRGGRCREPSRRKPWKESMEGTQLLSLDSTMTR